jgi:hypothetical protein
MTAFLRQPLSGLIPVVLSVAGVCLVLGHALVYGVTREADEGTAAHLFQLLALAQVPFLAYFFVRHVRERPVQSLPLLGVLAALWICAVLAVRLLT